jgi:hypothetical protein
VRVAKCMLHDIGIVDEWLQRIKLTRTRPRCGTDLDGSKTSHRSFSLSGDMRLRVMVSPCPAISFVTASLRMTLMTNFA